MARTALATQQITTAGLKPVYTAANVDGHSIDPAAILHVKNGSGSSINVTVQTPAQVDGLDVEELVVAIPAAEERLIGGLKPSTFARPSGPDAGRVYVDFSAVTTVTVAALGR